MGTFWAKSNQGIKEVMDKCLYKRRSREDLGIRLDIFELREVTTPYGKAKNLDSGNTFLWNQQPPPLIDQFFHEN